MADNAEPIESEWIDYEDLNESDIDRDDGDLFLEQRLELNNEIALADMARNCQLPDDLPWIETMVITSAEPISLNDVHDDMSREVAFQKQALEAARIGRELALEAGFSQVPTESEKYEMLKSAKTRQRQLAAAEADRIKLLKRRRKEEREELLNLKASDNGDDFAVDVPEQKRFRKDAKTPHRVAGMNKAKDFKSKSSKSAFATKGKGTKNTNGKKAVSRRPGKSKRQALRSKAR